MLLIKYENLDNQCDFCIAVITVKYDGGEKEEFFPTGGPHMNCLVKYLPATPFDEREREKEVLSVSAH